jgi:hypothetical protein
MAQLGVIRQGPSFTLTTPRSKKAAAPTTSQNLSSPYTGPYGGIEPGTISAQPFLDYMSKVSDLALDPQNELRNREQQRLQEQTRAGLEARGLNLSGAGQGIESDVMADFGLDWQNNLLGRATAGGQTLLGLGGLGQNIAQAGFTNSGELGASAFEYDPDVSGIGFGGGGGGGGYSYSPGSSYSGPSSFLSTPSTGSQRRAAQNASIQSYNAMAMPQYMAAKAGQRAAEYASKGYGATSGTPYLGYFMR